jgi:hypothetical protein
MTSGVNEGGEVPYQAYPPDLFSSNTTVDNSCTPEVGWVTHHVGRERRLLCLLCTANQQQLYFGRSKDGPDV